MQQPKRGRDRKDMQKRRGNIDTYLGVHATMPVGFDFYPRNVSMLPFISE